MSSALLQSFQIPNRVLLTHGPGGLPLYRLFGDGGSAALFVHGAHICEFTPDGSPPVLWMSRQSQFEEGKPIRGGIPVCWPWFGPHATDPARPAHGIARLRAWTPIESAVLHDGRVRMRLGFRPQEAERAWVHPDLHVELSVTVGRALEVELMTCNDSSEPLGFEDALHTYLAVSDLGDLRIRGLQGVAYMDKLDKKRLKIQEADIRFSEETDRVYHDRGSVTEVVEPQKDRRIRLKKAGSLSTVVWNPAVAKSKAMPDFGDDEWTEMCCVETANVGEDRRILLPGTRHSTRLCISLFP